jgi:hypothetical protein
MKPIDLKAGTLFYECQSGLNIEAACLAAPAVSEGHGGRQHWTWPARNTQTGEVISYALTEGLEHYGPRIYEAPQYCGMRNASIVFPLMGGEALEMETDAAEGDPLGLRHPAHLEAWARSLGEDGPAIPVKAWLAAALEISGKARVDAAFTQGIGNLAEVVTASLASAYRKEAISTYSHAVDFTAEVISTDAGGEGITPAMIRQALTDRLNSLSDQDLMQAVNIFDSAENDKDPEMDI